MLKKLFEKNDYIRLGEIDRAEREIKKLKELITNLQDQFMDGNISPNDFHLMKERTEKTLSGKLQPNFTFKHIRKVVINTKLHC